MRNPIPMLLVSTGLLLGCRAPPPAPAKSPPPSRSGPHQVVHTVDSCVDGWLTRKHLDSFGNPPDTNYPGGSPLMDEATGDRIDRFDYLYKRFPELAKLCRPPGK